MTQHENASVAQYGPPTPTPTTCVVCAPPPPTTQQDLPVTGFDAYAIACAGIVLMMCGLAGARLMRPGRRRP